jgi:hypothetical protein
MSRRDLSQRRRATASCFEHTGLRFRAHVGYFPDDSPGEIFLDCSKQNSAIDAVACDVAILISLLLQHGASPAAISHALRRTTSGAPASLLGAAVDHLQSVESMA